jgi:Fe-Mn family superoxide dismutase
MKRITIVWITGLFLLWSFAGISAWAGEIKPYVAQDFDHLKGMKDFSHRLLKQHFTLYEGYVKNTNLLLRQLAEMARSGQTATPEYAELTRRFSWEFNGMRLHELYFGNLGGTGKINQEGKLLKSLVENFGSFEKWAADFKAAGAMRGIGWVVLYEDLKTGRLFNVWINEHNEGNLAGGVPLLVMDVFEHAFLTDFGLNKGEYIKAFFQNIDWTTVESRFKAHH